MITKTAITVTLATLVILCCSRTSCFAVDPRHTLTELQQHLREHPPAVDKEPYRRMMMGIFDSVRSKEAEAEIQAFARKHPRDSSALVLLFVSHIMLGRVNEGLQAWNRLRTWKRVQRTFHIVRAVLHEIKGDDQSALDDVMRVDAPDPAILRWRASLHRRVSKPGMALIDLTEAIIMKPSFVAELYMERAEVFAECYDFHAADRDYKKAKSLGYGADDMEKTTDEDKQRNDEDDEDLEPTTEG